MRFILKWLNLIVFLVSANLSQSCWQKHSPAFPPLSGYSRHLLLLAHLLLLLWLHCQMQEGQDPQKQYKLKYFHMGVFLTLVIILPQSISKKKKNHHEPLMRMMRNGLFGNSLKYKWSFDYEIIFLGLFFTVFSPKSCLDR